VALRTILLTGLRIMAACLLFGFCFSVGASVCHSFEDVRQTRRGWICLSADPNDIQPFGQLACIDPVTLTASSRTIFSSITRQHFRDVLLQQVIKACSFLERFEQDTQNVLQRDALFNAFPASKLNWTIRASIMWLTYGYRSRSTIAKLVRNHTCMGCLGWHYREAFRAAATCVMREP
jgi:hypothetical protein